jgi:hypothetical protein
MGDLMSGTVSLRKNTILMPCGGNKGCLTPNEHPPLIGHYSPTTQLQASPGKRVPHRLPSYVSSQTASTVERAPAAELSHIKSFSPRAATRGACRRYEEIHQEEEQVRGLTPDPPVTTYQRDFEIWQREDRTIDDSASHFSGRTKVQSLDLASVRSSKTGRSASSGGHGEGPPATGGAGGQLTARALEQMEAIEEERERTVMESPRGRKPAFGDKVFGDPPPMTHPQTGKTVRPHHQHLYLPLAEQLKRIIPDFTPATSAAVTDRSHYNDAKARAERYNKERAQSREGSVTARAWYSDADKARAGRQRKEGGGVRVRLETTKMFRALPIGAERKTGEQMLNEIDAARAERIATGKIAPFNGENKIAPFTREQEAAARVIQEDARSGRLPVRRLGQRNLPSVLRAGYGVEEVDRLQKSRSPSQGGANIDTQAVLSPSILKTRLKAQEERARRRHLSPITTPRVSPCAKAFTSIQTESMLGYDYRVANGMQNKDGHVWRYTPPPRPFTPPTPVHLHTSPRSKISHANSGS